jgi:hypothetical protein
MQYASDVNSNIQQGGLAPGDFVSNLSSPRQYAVSATKGAVVGGAAAGTAILGAGAVAVGGVTGAATAVTDYLGNRATGQANSWSAVAQDAALNGLTGGAFAYLPGVPGRLPSLFSRSFFTGSHMQNALAQNFAGSSLPFFISAGVPVTVGAQISLLKNTLLAASAFLSAQKGGSAPSTQKHI